MPQRHRIRPIGLALGAALALCLAPAPAPAASPPPLDPQPAADALAPGLAVRYYSAFFRAIDEFVEHMQQDQGVAGAPIPNIDSRVVDGPVLTSGDRDGVGAKITGLIRFDVAGTYSMVAQSNDGVRLEIGGVLVLEDPDVHGDRYSRIAKVEVPRAGWYALDMLYFERKGTSTIQLFWKTPDNPAADMAIVPADRFAHLKGG